MNHRPKDKREVFLHGALTVFGSQIASQGAGFLRSIIVARLTSPADFGIASALNACIVFVYTFTDLGCSMYLARAERSDDQSLLASSHTLTLIRCILSSVPLFLLAPHIAHFFGMAQHAWAFGTIAIVPILRGLSHNDIWLMQREMKFGGTFMCEVVPQLVTLALAFPLAWWMRDFSAMLWLLLLSAAITLITSHVVARYRYRLGWNPAQIRGMLRFGWPVLLNGALIFAVVYGERVVIGNAYGQVLLGVYSAVLLLSSTPAQALSRIVGWLGLPHIASYARRRDDLVIQYTLMVDVSSLGAICMAAPLCLAGPLWVRLVFGTHYHPTAGLVIGLTLAQAFQIVRTTPTMAAVALGDTLTPALANILRSVALSAAWLLALRGANVTVIAYCGAVGELAATGFSAWRLALGHKVAGATRRIVPATTVLIGCGVFGALAGELSLPTLCSVSLAVLGTVAGCAVIFFTSPLLRRQLREILFGYWDRWSSGASVLLRSQS